MFTGSPEYIRHFYQVERALRSYTIYTLVKASDSNRIKLPKTVRIEPFRGKSNTSGVNYLLRVREPNRWHKNTLTGLRPTGIESVFYGDHFTNGKKSLLFLHLVDNSRVLIIDYFNGFYPNHTGILNGMIRNHDFNY